MTEYLILAVLWLYAAINCLSAAPFYMKQLIIIRHAKAESGGGQQADFDRVLSETGKTDAQSAGLFLKNILNEKPFVLASPAKRTRQTAEIIAKGLGLDARELHFEPDIYQAGGDKLLSIVRSLPEHVNTAILVGHNPGVSWLLQLLSGEETEKFPPCTIAGLRFQVATWQLVEEQCGQIDCFHLANHH